MILHFNSGNRLSIDIDEDDYESYLKKLRKSFNFSDDQMGKMINWNNVEYVEFKY